MQRYEYQREDFVDFDQYESVESTDTLRPAQQQHDANLQLIGAFLTEDDLDEFESIHQQVA